MWATDWFRISSKRKVVQNVRLHKEKCGTEQSSFLRTALFQIEEVRSYLLFSHLLFICATVDALLIMCYRDTPHKKENSHIYSLMSSHM